MKSKTPKSNRGSQKGSLGNSFKLKNKDVVSEPSGSVSTPRNAGKASVHASEN